MTQTILHLVDDLTPGGITRFLDHLETLPEVKGCYHQQRVAVGRGRWSAPRLSGDLIVSHLSISWRNLPMFLALRAKHPNTPMIHVEHTYTAGFMAQDVRHPTRFKTLLRTVFALFDHVVAVSSAQHAWFLQSDLLRDGHNSVINPSVDIAPFLDVKSTDLSAKRFGAIGRLEDPKGVDILLRAFRSSAPEGATLSIFGTGDAKPRLTALAGQDPRIHFKGHADPVAAIASCDVIVMPSRRESYGLVALEARAASRTVMVSGVDGLSDHVKDGAILVGSSVEDWQRAFANMADHQDPDRLRVARSRAIESARKSRNDWNALFQRFASTKVLQLAS